MATLVFADAYFSIMLQMKFAANAIFKFCFFFENKFKHCCSVCTCDWRFLMWVNVQYLCGTTVYILNCIGFFIHRNEERRQKRVRNVSSDAVVIDSFLRWLYSKFLYNPIFGNRDL